MLGLSLGLPISSGAILEPGTPPPPPMSVSWIRADYDNYDYMLAGARLSNIPNTVVSATGVARFKVNRQFVFTAQRLICMPDAGGVNNMQFSMENGASDTPIRVRFFAGGGTELTRLTSTVLLNDGDTYLCAWSYNGNTGDFKIAFYDGVTWTNDPATPTIGTPASFDWTNNADAGLMGDPVATSYKSDMEIGLLYLRVASDDSAYMDVHDSTNHGILNGEPTGFGLGTPQILYYGDVASWATNQGNGGNLTQYGQLRDVPLPTYAHENVQPAGAIHLNSNPSGLPNGGYFTVAFKVKFGSVTGLASIIRCTSAASPGTGGIFNILRNSTNLLFSFLDSTATYGTSNLAEVGYVSTGVEYTIHIAASKDSGGVAQMWINGSPAPSSPWAWTGYSAGDIDFSTLEANILAAYSGIQSLQTSDVISFLYIHIGNTSASYQTDPTLFYDGGDVDLGSDGTLSGALAPQIFFGGRQSADERRGYSALGWNDGHNQGSVADTYTVTSSLNDV